MRLLGQFQTFLFFIHKKMLPFLFLIAYMCFVLFVRVKSFCRKKKFKTALMTSFTLLLFTWFFISQKIQK